MVTLPTETGTFNAFEKELALIKSLLDQMRTSTQQMPANQVPPALTGGINLVTNSLDKLRKQVTTLDNERSNLRALAQINQVINSSLELDEVLQIVMDTIIRLTKAERGFLMLRNEKGELTIRVARDWEQGSLDSSELTVSSTVIYKVANSGQPILTTNAQEDTRFSGQQSVVAYNLRSILCVPFKVKDDLIGVIYADSRIRTALFNQKDLDLLFAFANQAAIAIENARLFASVKQTLAEVTELKNLMDNVFKSIASGVLTADNNDRITLSNRAAEAILGHEAHELIGRGLDQVLPPLATVLKPYLEQVIKTEQSVVDLEFTSEIPHRGSMDLRVSISPLKDIDQDTQGGVAIVLDDLTEKKRLEAQYRLFERMVSPAVIQHLNPDSLKLGGQKSEITTLFADIRGFTSFSETVSPEELVAVLNRHLAAAAEAVLFEDGTIDKFLGDAVMAWFNAPVPQPDHTLRAVRAALAIRSDLQELHKTLPQHQCLSFGVGIHVGDAVLGLIGTEKRLEFTAIGDSVNTAKRIQENAAHGQILISHDAYQYVADQVLVEMVDPIQAKGKREPVPVYRVLRLK